MDEKQMQISGDAPRIKSHFPGILELRTGTV
jgi:hypothetical protein